MSFSTTAIKYGWVYLTALGVITGTTIYVASNTRHQVKPEDIIEIVLGVHERCLATQITTNPTYSVDPPSIVRTWTDTNGASIIVTNTIGWHTDRVMMIDLDTKIKALVPHYVDTNTVYDGTTNIVMLTVTGLWATLGIGDGTNQFTRTPAWVGTNGTTNAATYGAYPWQIYEADLVERYKVLEALKMTKVNGVNTNGRSAYGWDYWVYAYRGSYDGAVAVFYSNQWQNTTAAEKSYSWTYWQGHVYEEPDLHLLQWAVSKIQYKHLFSVCYANFSYVLERWVHVNLPVTGTTNTFNGFGAVTGIGWEKHGETSDATNVFDYIGSASAPDEASEPDVEYTTHTMGYDIAAVWGLISWDFNYCTNKYW